jgi:cell division transport system permease protein
MPTPSVTVKLRRRLAPRLDIPFARDDANRYLPYFIALMIFLAAFFLAGGITVGALLEDKKQDFSEWLTLQVPSDMSEKQRKSLLKNLAEDAMIAEAVVLEDSEIADLLSPWFGESNQIIQTLNVPFVIEIKLKDRSNFDLEAYRKTLTQNYPSVTLDGHEQWIEHYLNFIRILEFGAYLLAFLVVIATTVIIIFTSKTALKLHQNAIQLLHSVGAEDDYIARQFQFNAFLLGMRGGVIGVAIAAALFFALGLSVNEVNTALLPNFPITGLHLFTWFILPPLTGLLSLYVARKTVLAMLRKMA